LGRSNPCRFHDRVPSNHYGCVHRIPFSDGRGTLGYYHHTDIETFRTFWQAEGTGRKSLETEIPNAKFQIPNNIGNSKSNHLNFGHCNFGFKNSNNHYKDKA
jgi:hypothetical protein